MKRHLKGKSLGEEPGSREGCELLTRQGVRPKASKSITMQETEKKLHHE